MSPAAPKKFGNWVVIRKEGSGGFGSAYLARHVATGQKAIIKQMDPVENNRLGAKDKDYFKREATILHELDSKYISALLDWDLRPAKPWMAIQYFPGTTLADYINQGSIVSEAQWFQMAHDILSGLEHAHSKGVVHRDLNPKNIILFYEGARLIDFGLSRFTEDPNSTRVIGFDGFVAPEIGQGNPKPPFDIFVAATALCAAGTGRMPWRSTGGNYYNSIVNDTPDYQGLTQNQIELLTKMHAKNPGDRVTAKEALELVEQLSPATAGVHIPQPKKVRPVEPAPTFKANPPKANNQQRVIKTPVVDVNVKLSKTSEGIFDWIKRHKEPALLGLFTGGWGLLPYFVLSIWSKSKHLNDRSKVILSINYGLMFLSFGIVTPIINFYWYLKSKITSLALIAVGQLALMISLFVGAAITPNGGTLPNWSGFSFLGLFASNFITIRQLVSIVSDRQKGRSKSAQESQEPLPKTDSQVTNAHDSWEEVEEIFRQALTKIGSKRFVIGIEGVYLKGIFFQGFTEPDGSRTLEAAADLSVRPKITTEQRANLNALGWDSPDEGLPNFIQFISPENSDVSAVAKLLTNTLRDGYGINIGTFKVDI